MSHSLGIDESNMGRWPRVYVGVLSNRPQDLEVSSLEKIRNWEPISAVAMNRPYRHLLVTQYDLQTVGEEAIKFIVVDRFYNAFKSYNGGIGRIILDGTIGMTTLSLLEKRIMVDGIPLIQAIPEADVKYGVVNCADGIAHKLRNAYCLPESRKKGDKSYNPNDYLDTQIDFVKEPYREDVLLLKR
jgi:hypothetical protein